MQDLGEKINIEIFNWGPCVVKCKIKPEFANVDPLFSILISTFVKFIAARQPLFTSRTSPP